MLVNHEADGATVIERIEHTAISKVVGETTLLKHLTGEGGEDKMEGFVEKHNRDRCAVRHSRREVNSKQKL